MSGLVLIGGPPGPNLALLRDELCTREHTRQLDFCFPSFLQRLREATQHRATVWQGVDARPADWIEPALQRLAEATALALTRGDGWCIDARPDNAWELEWLSRTLPDAHFVLLVRAGRLAPASVSTPLAALDWAREWARASGPIAEAAESLGARAQVVREEELVAEPSRVLANVAERLELPTPRAWNGPAPQSCAPLPNDLFECFTACGAARRWSTALGYELPWPGADCDRWPDVALELVRTLVAEQRLDEARSHAAHAVALQPCGATHEALGLVELRAGRETQAVQCFLRAIQAEEGRVGPWRELFALSHRPELLVVAEFARASQQAEIRAVLARWLVARGLDREAAEVVANVAHQPWQNA